MAAPMIRKTYFCPHKKLNFAQFKGMNSNKSYVVLKYLYTTFCQCQKKASLCRTFSNFASEKSGRDLLYSAAMHRVHNARALSRQVESGRGQSDGKKYVLGIETSCDDTGAAVVDEDGNIIGEALHNQTKTHIQLGGIIPPVARDLHMQNIKDVVDTAMRRAGMKLKDLDAIATTVKPGLPLSLRVGLSYAKELVRESEKPFIPIHHMEAHALTARMIERIEFPFLVLLISGGHCLLAVARGVDDFLLLGQSVDDAPGDAFDKVARRLKLKNLPEFESVSGGQAIETLANLGDVQAFPFTPVMGQSRNCDFSFSGLKTKFHRLIENEETRQGVAGGSVLPNAADVCASFQYDVLHHLAKRLQRALIFTEMKGYLPDSKEKTLVVSGGVASNTFLRRGLEKMGQEYSCRLICPPPKLCTDNGIMIAWNGMEKLKLGRGITTDIDSVDIQGKCQLGEDISKEVGKATIRLRPIKLL